MNLLVCLDTRIKMSVLMRQFGKVRSYLAAQGHRNQGFEKTGYLKPHGVSVSTLKLFYRLNSPKAPAIYACFLEPMQHGRMSDTLVYTVKLPKNKDCNFGIYYNPF